MTRRGCSGRPMQRCTRSSGVRRTAWRGGGERPPELRIAPPKTRHRVEHRARRRRRAEIERAAVQVVAQAVADEMRLAHDERPREERLDARAEAVHVLGRDAVVVVVPRIHAPRIAGARGACERCLDALAPWLLVSPSWQPCSMASGWWRWRTGASSPPPAPRWATGARRW